ncbi:DUF6263 family protein [Kriegella aquimaris]|uniref:Uncharacterized protein n=1 Tax=Kriegella aquimaris TaxID=192904 RepID=A0A1G9NND2_9FLAO|nr:DUF6263 family protein [Kriegella aquimaris]SDL87874.1 hypothetical protein SAMN04488514_103251 [Kriegella aquimaris]
MKQALTLFVMITLNYAVFGQLTLEYKLNKGDIFTIKQNAQQIITQNLDGATHELTNTINGVLQLKVLNQEEDNYNMELIFKDLNLKINSSIQGELMNVNAKEVTAEDVQSQIFNTLLDNPVQMTLSKTGDILEVRGGDSLVLKMANASGLTDAFSLNMMKKSLEKEFGSEALSNSYKQLTYIYPSKKIKVGDTWENEYLGKLSAKNSWTLKSLTDSTASISGKAEITMDIKEPTTTMKLTGKQETEITADKTSGFIQKMKVEGESEGTSTIVQMGDQEIPTHIKSTITYELIN